MDGDHDRVLGHHGVDRGGSWYGGARRMRVAGRSGLNVDYRSYLIGFRLSRTIP